jgi:ADP-heptose:LPS heptosyltransferase
MSFKPIETLLYCLVKVVRKFDRRDISLAALRPESVKSILLVSSTAIGDTLLSTPAFRAVRERYPHARITAHLNVQNMELFAGNPHIDTVIPYYGGYRRFWRTILAFRKEHFDLALILHGNEPQATPMAYLGGARFIIKLPNRNEYAFLLSNQSELYGWEDFHHGVDQRVKVAQLAGCSSVDKRMEVYCDSAGNLYVEDFFHNHGITADVPVIGFQVGASTVSRMWFADRFVELGKRLLSEYPDMRILLTGSPQEKSYCEGVAAGIGERAIVSAGDIPLRSMPALLKRCVVLVTGDTGIMHLAIAVGTTVTALFAVADPRKSGPYYDMDKHRVIKKERTCEPCVSKKCIYQKCMEQITVDEVFTVVQEVLVSHGYKPRSSLFLS